MINDIVIAATGPTVGAVSITVLIVNEISVSLPSETAAIRLGLNIMLENVVQGSLIDRGDLTLFTNMPMDYIRPKLSFVIIPKFSSLAFA